MIRLKRQPSHLAGRFPDPQTIHVWNPDINLSIIKPIYDPNVGNCSSPMAESRRLFLCTLPSAHCFSELPRCAATVCSFAHGTHPGHEHEVAPIPRPVSLVMVGSGIKPFILGKRIGKNIDV